MVQVTSLKRLIIAALAAACSLAIASCAYMESPSAKRARYEKMLKQRADSLHTAKALKEAEFKKNFNQMLDSLNAAGTRFTDERNGKTYRIAKIGAQTWMAENLNYNIPGSQCYDNNPENCDKYGRLYEWEQAKNACPKGWHLPSNPEWQILLERMNHIDSAGVKLKAKTGWDGYRSDFVGGIHLILKPDDLDEALFSESKEKELRPGNGTDEYGFAALPGGYMKSSLYNEQAAFLLGMTLEEYNKTDFAKPFEGIGKKGIWWSNTRSRYDSGFSWSVFANGGVIVSIFNASDLLSVRCVKG